MGVGDLHRVLAVALAGDGIAVRSHAHELVMAPHLLGVVPVAAPARPDRLQARGAVGRRGLVGGEEVVPGTVQPGSGPPTRDRQRDRPGHERARAHPERAQADAPAPAIGQRPHVGTAVDDEPRDEQHGHHEHAEQGELLARVDALGERGSVLGQRVVGERPHRHRRGAGGPGEQDREPAQAQRDDGEPEGEADDERDQHAA
jgi:hypothetical protein